MKYYKQLNGKAIIFRKYDFVFMNFILKLLNFIMNIVESTRKYPLRGYFLGPPGWPESIFFPRGLRLTFFSYSHF